MQTFAEFHAELLSESEEIVTPTFSVPLFNIPALQTMLTKLNKTAAKLHVAPVTIKNVGNTYLKKISESKRNDFGDIVPAQFAEFQDIEVIGTSPKIDGWSFAGKLEPLNGEVIAKSMPGHQLPAEYQNVKAEQMKCDHCGKIRRRNDTYVVTDGHDFKQVGRSCLKDFMGSHGDPTAMASFAESLSNLTDMVRVFSENDGSWGGGGRGFPAVHLEELVADAIHDIEAVGFVSKQGEDPTSSRVFRSFFPPQRVSGDKTPIFKITPTEADKAKAPVVIEYMRSHPEIGKSEFWNNISKIVKHDVVDPKYFGYVIAGVNTFLKDEGTAKLRTKLSDGISEEPIAPYDSKVKIEAEVIFANKYQRQSYGYYDSGVSMILTMKTAKGQLIKMFTTNLDAQVGDKVALSGKIGVQEPEKFDKSPFKGKMVTLMQPRTRLTIQA